MRTFIAIDLDENIKKELAAFINEMCNLPASIRWTHSKGMHLTLKFLGEIKEDQIPAIMKLLENTTAFFKSFTLEFKGTGWFPPGSRFPRVIWAGCQENEIILSLQQTIEDDLEKLHFQRDKKTYHPHLTLGRVRSNKNIHKVVDELIRQSDKNFGSMTVNKVTFFQSKLKPTGAEYLVLSEHMLK
ncbi:MAG: RNA 2',3'-cyclic phosphodiesterase [Candidatus Aminicenantes bacterium]|nr:RNA 2',3'-cyclic phosphodiesterase [Candidatus Aminicenantes bacterium]